jgi:hypothetical protein
MGERQVPLPGRSWQEHAAGLERPATRGGGELAFHGKQQVPTVVFTGRPGLQRLRPEASVHRGRLGKGIYFTDTPADLSANYAGMGPDLTLKLERQMESRIIGTWTTQPPSRMRVPRP